MKKPSVTFLLWCCGFIGLCGLHRFYVGRTFTGFLWLLTLGLLGFGQLFDLFFIGSMTRQANLLNGMGHAYGAMANVSNTNTVAPVIHVNVSVPGHSAPNAGVSAPALSAEETARLSQAAMQQAALVTPTTAPVSRG
jgi:TM2 domain-containing membrane protein YozV